MEGFQSADMFPRQSGRVLTSKAIQWSALAVVLLVALASIGSLVRTIWAKSLLSGRDSRYVIVSSRPKTTDVRLILASDEKDVKYLRPDEAFAKALLKGAALKEGELRVFEFGPTTLRGEASLESLDGYLDLRKAAETLPSIPFAVVVGLALGFLIPFAGHWLGPWMFGVAGVAFVKLATDCSTCPQATVLGVDAALLGGGLFLLAGASFLLSSGTRAVTGAVVACATLWQVLSAWNLKEFCLPCTTVALATSWAATSAVVGRESRGSAPRFLSHALPWLAAVSMAFLTYLGAAPPDVPEAEAKTGTSALGMPKKLRIDSLKQLGLAPYGYPVALYVGHEGCHPCMEGLEAIDAIDLKGLTFVYTGENPPDTKRDWKRLPSDKLISITPSVIFADAKGNVVDQEFGFATSTEYLEGFSKKLARFKDGSAR